MNGDAAEPLGLPLERTALAWERTALSFAIAGLAAAGVFAPVDGAAVAFALVATVAAVATLAVAAWRYRAAHRRASRGGSEHRAGALVAVMSVAVVALGVACVAYAVGGLAG